MTAKKIILWGLVAFFVIGVLGAALSPDEPEKSVALDNKTNSSVVASEPTSTPTTLVTKLTAVQLINEYKENTVRADQKYKNQSVEVSGTTKNIDKDILGAMYVTFEIEEYSINTVQCYFDKSKTDEVAMINKGQLITLRGTVSGDSLGNVLVKNCEIVK